MIAAALRCLLEIGLWLKTETHALVPCLTRIVILKIQTNLTILQEGPTAMKM